MKAVQRFNLESIRYRAGEYKCEDCGLLCIAGEVIRAEDFDAYRRKVAALVAIVKTIKPQHPRNDLDAAIAALGEDV
jgi:hypothetical protein